jgi:hypothetical protein
METWMHDGLLIGLAVFGVVLQILILAGVAYAVRLLRRSTADGERFRRLARRRSGRILKQGEVAARTAARAHLDTQRQAQAWANLQLLLRFEAAVPPAGGWAGSADFLLVCVDQLLERRPAVVVECGSGITTLMLALAVEQHQLPTRIIALEHQDEYAARTRQLLERHGVVAHAEIRLAPLAPSSVADHDTPWYDEAALVGLEEIGMLLVDGPPMGTGRLARYPAVPLLIDQLADRCVILMDDMFRESDRRTAELWADLLGGFDYRLDRDLEKGLGVFRRG